MHVVRINTAPGSFHISPCEDIASVTKKLFENDLNRTTLRNMSYSIFSASAISLCDNFCAQRKKFTEIYLIVVVQKNITGEAISLLNSY